MFLFSTALKAMSCLPPEAAHSLSLSAINLADRLSCIPVPSVAAKNAVPVNIWGLTFPNAVGLAAGLDKNGDHMDALAQLGFGFIEIGTLTPKPQPGNPRPRLFRLTKDQAIVNRMGFNNKGIDYAIAQIKKSRFVRAGGILGVNIGKNRDTPLKDAGNDYLTASYTRYIGKIAALRTPLAKLPQHTDLSFDEHKKIAVAVREGDMAKIKALLLEHIDRTRQAYKSAAIVMDGAIAS